MAVSQLRANSSNIPPREKSDYQMLKEGGYKNIKDFALSHGLKFHEHEGIQNAKEILQAMRGNDQKAWNEERKEMTRDFPDRDEKWQSSDLYLQNPESDYEGAHDGGSCDGYEDGNGTQGDYFDTGLYWGYDIGFDDDDGEDDIGHGGEDYGYDGYNYYYDDDGYDDDVEDGYDDGYDDDGYDDDGYDDSYEDGDDDYDDSYYDE